MVAVYYECSDFERSLKTGFDGNIVIDKHEHIL